MLKAGRSLFITAAIILLIGCSSWVRTRNAFSLPIQIVNLVSLDSLDFQPRHVRFLADQLEGHQELTEDIRIKADPEHRSTWKGHEAGCLTISNGAEVIIEDMNFISGGMETQLIHLRDGELTLINSQIAWGAGVGIKAEPGTRLILQDVSVKLCNEGGIEADSADILIYVSQFEDAGAYPVRVSNSRLFEAHHSRFSGGQLASLFLEGVEEVWLDTVVVDGGFQSGIQLNGVGLAILNHTTVEDNGTVGITAEKCGEIGILDSRISRNRRNGIQISGGDSLRIVNSEVGANGGSGIHSTLTGFLGIAGTALIRNEESGLSLENVDSLLLHHSLISMNQSSGIRLNDIQRVMLSDLQISGNGSHDEGAGIRMLEVDESILSRIQIRGNRADGMFSQGGQRLSITRSVFEEHLQHGLRAEAVNAVFLKQNSFHQNVFGFAAEGVADLKSRANRFDSNRLGWTSLQIAALDSDADTVQANSVVGMDFRTGTNGEIRNSYIRGNRVGINATAATIRVSNLTSHSNSLRGLQLTNGQIQVVDSRFDSDKTALFTEPGTVLRLGQVQLSRCDLGVSIGESSRLEAQLLKLTEGNSGLVIADYGQTLVNDAEVSGMSGAVITTEGPHILTSEMNFGFFRDNKLLFWTHHTQGEFLLGNATIVNSDAIWDGDVDSRVIIQNSILQGIRTEVDLLAACPSYRNSWFWKITGVSQLPSTLQNNGNNLENPLIESDGFLAPSSPCIDGGADGGLVGARGERPHSTNWKSP